MYIFVAPGVEPKADQSWDPILGCGYTYAATELAEARWPRKGIGHSPGGSRVDRKNTSGY